MDVDTKKSPHTDVSLNDSPYMDQGPNNSTHLDGGVSDSRQTDHDDTEDQPQFENRTIQDDDIGSYWPENNAGHCWSDAYGWLVLKPRSPPEAWWIEDPPPRSPSDPDYLCDVCRHIDFRWFFENNISKSIPLRQRKISIGTVGRVVKQANCSFCVLLAPSCELENEGWTVSIESKFFPEGPALDYNHPETEVKYLSIGIGWRKIYL